MIEGEQKPIQLKIVRFDVVQEMILRQSKYKVYS